MRTSVLIAALTGTAIAFATPALAAPPLEGTYTAVLTNASGGTLDQEWVFNPCGPGCARRAGDDAEFRLQGNRWLWTPTPTAKGVTDFDATTLAGTIDFGVAGTAQIQLTKVG